MSATVAASPTVSAIALAVSALYGITKSATILGMQAAVALKVFFDSRIEEMKSHENTTIARIGRVLDSAKWGFGIGYVTSVAIVAAGSVLVLDLR